MTTMRPVSPIDSRRPLEWDTVTPQELEILANLFRGGDEEWQDLAACSSVDGDLFFPEKGGSTKEAKRICQGCDVRAECLSYAVDRGERYGIYGGTSWRERRKLMPPKPLTTKDAEAIRLAGLDWTTAAIALAIGVTDRTVLRILARAEKRAVQSELAS